MVSAVGVTMSSPFGDPFGAPSPFGEPNPFEKSAPTAGTQNNPFGAAPSAVPGGLFDNGPSDLLSPASKKLSSALDTYVKPTNQPKGPSLGSITFGSKQQEQQGAGNSCAEMMMIVDGPTTSP